MNIFELPKNRLGDIEPLWNELNDHHFEKSADFKDHFLSMAFDDRTSKFVTSDHLKIYVAECSGELVGYCIASVSGADGEIDSLYVKSKYQKASLGKKLMGAAMSWLSSSGCASISIRVAAGNESAISYYEKFGFKKKSYILQANNS